MAITSDIIVGFPGETDSDFDDTMDMIERVRYDALFAFKYSPRPETRAAGMTDQVPEDIKDRRLSNLFDKQREISLEKNREYEGRVVEVLVEGRDPERLSGKTRTFKTVYVKGDEKLIGETLMVRITKGSANSLTGEII